LKGACFVAEDEFNPQPWRYMDDLDILVKASCLDTAFEAVRALGYTNLTEGYHIDVNVHYPMLVHPSLPAGVEIHERFMRWPIQGLTDNETLLASTSTIESPYGRFLVPDVTMRILYLIANAQLKDNCYRRRIFRLRDAIDFAVLVARDSSEINSVHSMFSKAGKEDEFLTFVHTCEQIFNKSWIASKYYKHSHRHWTEVAFSGLRDPSTLRRYFVQDWIMLAGSIVTNPSRWKTAYWTLVLSEKRNQHIDLLRKQIRFLKWPGAAKPND
jgi:hypothetical protein